MHTDAPSTDVVPARQAVHAVDPEELKKPATQDAQLDVPVAAE